MQKRFEIIESFKKHKVHFKRLIWAFHFSPLCIQFHLNRPWCYSADKRFLNCIHWSFHWIILQHYQTSPNSQETEIKLKHLSLKGNIQKEGKASLWPLSPPHHALSKPSRHFIIFGCDTLLLLLHFQTFKKVLLLVWVLFCCSLAFLCCLSKKEEFQWHLMNVLEDLYFESATIIFYRSLPSECYVNACCP